MELEKAIEELKRTIEENNRLLLPHNEQFFNKKEKQEIRMQNTAIETVLQALDNSISKEKVEKIEKYCKTKSKFQTFGDEELERTIEMYVNKTKNDVLSLLEE